MSAQKHQRVALLLGGDSPEREISLKSGGAVGAALDRLGVEVVHFDPSERPICEIVSENVDAAFNILHGGSGENGIIQGALSAMGIPQTGSKSAACALSMDKHHSKLIWQAIDIPTPGFRIVRKDDDLSGIPTPAFVKPINTGSSVGAGPANTPEELSTTVATALRYGDTVIIEEKMTGAELTAGILAGECLPLIRLETPHDFYDYEAKYSAPSTHYHCPAGLSDEQEQKIRKLCLDAFLSLGCEGWGRVDLMLDADGNPQILEANSVPGMTDHSLVPMAAKAAGISFDELVGRILEGASC